MSWLGDGFKNFTEGWGRAWHDVTSVGGHFENDVSKFFENEVVNKSELRGAQFESALSGLPVIGDIIKGIEGINQLEDLYNNTGKVPEYPGAQNVPGTSLGRGVEKLSGKIEAGTHDLFEHYSGNKDDTLESLHKKGIMKYGDEL